MKVRKVDCSKRLTLTKVYFKSGQNYITNWGSSYIQLGQMLLQVGAASFYYKLEQVFYEKVGQVLLQVRAALFCYKLGQVLLQIGVAFFNYKLVQLNYYKLGQVLLQIGAAIIN